MALRNLGNGWRDGFTQAFSRSKLPYTTAFRYLSEIFVYRKGCAVGYSIDFGGAMASEPTIDRAKKRLALWWAVRNVTGMVNTFFGYSQKDFVSSVVRSILHEGGTLILRNAYYAHREIFDLAIDFSGSRLKLWERDGDEYASISNRPASLENKMLQCGEPKW